MWSICNRYAISGRPDGRDEKDIHHLRSNISTKRGNRRHASTLIEACDCWPFSVDILVPDIASRKAHGAAISLSEHTASAGAAHR